MWRRAAVRHEGGRNRLMPARRVIREQLRRRLRNVDLAADANVSIDASVLNRRRRRRADRASPPQDDERAEARSRNPTQVGRRD